jgi:hypothetical protein
MSTNADQQNHIPESRLIEISQTAAEFSDQERAHIARCERCAGRLTALFRLQRGDH